MRENLTLEQMKANRKLWVEALRSGKYQQTREKLKAKGGGMCCLGVLAEIAGCTWEYDAFEEAYRADGEAGYAPQAAMDFVGLSRRDGAFDIDDEIALADLNDAGQKFKTIADIIESEPDGLFVSEVQP